MCTNPLIALGTHLRSLLRDRSGNFAILTALLMVPLMGALGLAVDYARVSHARYVLLGAAERRRLGSDIKGFEDISERPRLHRRLDAAGR